jgi:glycopeptide antibiotics resistance protein
MKRGTPRSAALSRSALDVTLIASVVSVLCLTLLPPIGAPRKSTVFVPFSEFQYAEAADVMLQLVGNVILFAPLGFLAPLRWHRLDSILRVVVVSAALSVLIELLQLGLPGRQTSVTDVIMNIAGATIGYLMMRALRGLIRRGSPVASDRMHS